jgi:hypothetical protein
MLIKLRKIIEQIKMHQLSLPSRISQKIIDLYVVSSISLHVQGQNAP